jgi:hypothetical protein
MFAWDLCLSQLCIEEKKKNDNKNMKNNYPQGMGEMSHRKKENGGL